MSQHVAVRVLSWFDHVVVVLLMNISQQCTCGGDRSHTQAE